MQTIIDQFQSVIRDTALAANTKFWDMLPEILLTIVVIFVGWIVAVIIYHLVLQVMSFFAIDKLAAKTPLQSMLKNVGIHRTVSEILGLLIFWLMVLLTLVIAADILELEQVSEGLGAITNYIPQIIAAILIIIVGMLVAKFLQMLAVQTLSKTGVMYSKFVGKTVQIVILVFVFAAAFDQLGFNFSELFSNILLIVAAFVLIIGLGLPFGARTTIDNLIACQQLKRQLPIGARVEIENISGTVKGFTLTSVLLDAHGKTVVYPSAAFFQQKYTVHESNN